ncbi:MAG: prepilin-type N-terminal cleavage/methylation domain-containing protein [Candidatus Omnitrophota bacterium]
MSNPNKGFTLVEMLIVMVIMSMISLAIYSTFNSGVKIWKRLNNQISAEDVSIFFERLEADLKNNFKYEGMDFVGDKAKLSFPTLVNSLDMEKRAIGQVIYSYDQYAGSVIREEKDFSRVHRDIEGNKRTVLKEITSLVFDYYFYSEEDKDYSWEESLDKDKDVLAVRVRLGLKDGKEKETFSKTVRIQHAKI